MNKLHAPNKGDMIGYNWQSGTHTHKIAVQNILWLKWFSKTFVKNIYKKSTLKPIQPSIIKLLLTAPVDDLFTRFRNQFGGIATDKLCLCDWPEDFPARPYTLRMNMDVATSSWWRFRERWLSGALRARHEVLRWTGKYLLKMHICAY